MLLFGDELVAMFASMIRNPMANKNAWVTGIAETCNFSKNI